MYGAWNVEYYSFPLRCCQVTRSTNILESLDFGLNHSNGAVVVLCNCIQSLS